MEQEFNKIQTHVARWFSSDAATQGKTIRQGKMRRIITPRRDFDMATLQAGDQDFTAWCREAVRTLAEETPDGATVADIELKVVKEAFLVKAWLELYILEPNDQAQFSSEAR